MGIVCSPYPDGIRSFLFSSPCRSQIHDLDPCLSQYNRNAGLTFYAITVIFSPRNLLDCLRSCDRYQLIFHVFFHAVVVSAILSSSPRFNKAKATLIILLANATDAIFACLRAFNCLAHRLVRSSFRSTQLSTERDP